MAEAERLRKQEAQLWAMMWGQQEELAEKDRVDEEAKTETEKKKLFSSMRVQGGKSMRGGGGEEEEEESEKESEKEEEKESVGMGHS